MNARTPIPSKVRLLVPVLGSDQDGEALAAARAIKRTLHSAGLDLHALAQSIPVQGSGPKGDVETSHAPRPDSARPYRRAPPREAHTSAGYRWREAWAQHHRPRVFTPKQEAQHREQATYCLRVGGGRLNHYEQSFIRNVVRLRGNLTYAQASWLSDITDRLEQEDRHAWA